MYLEVSVGSLREESQSLKVGVCRRFKATVPHRDLIRSFTSSSFDDAPVLVVEEACMSLVRTVPICHLLHVEQLELGGLQKSARYGSNGVLDRLR